MATDLKEIYRSPVVDYGQEVRQFTIVCVSSAATSTANLPVHGAAISTAFADSSTINADSANTGLAQARVTTVRVQEKWLPNVDKVTIVCTGPRLK